MKNDIDKNKLSNNQRLFYKTLLLSFGAIIIFYIISLKHWFELTVILPIQPLL